MTLKSLAAGLVFSAVVAVQAIAAPHPVTLAPMIHQQATLTIHTPDGTVHVYTPDDLEHFPTYSMITTTPWRTTPAEFEGILLKDLLKANGMENLPAIRVVAENDFTTTIERAVWESVPVLVATRVDGKPHSRRARGPIQFVIANSDYKASPVVEERHMVWMAASIAPAP